MDDPTIHEQEQHLHNRKVLFLRTCILLIFLGIFWALAYFITDFLFEMYHVHLQGVWIQVINSILGIFLFWFTAIAYHGLNAKERKKKRVDVFKPFTEALEQIAKGNYKVSIDVGEQHPYRELAQNVNEMAEGLEKLEKMRQAFIADVSHEIQSPLTSINGFAQVLQRDVLSREESLHYLKIIESESKRLSKLSDNLLKLASLDSEQHPFNSKRYRLDKQLRRVILSSEPQWLAKSIALNMDLETTYWTADEALMDQVWLNLLSNSIKFTPENGKIEIQIQVSESAVSVHVRDNGIGLEPIEVEHIFERFYKADASRDRKSEGNGLGLAIVLKIVEMHGGKIDVQSEVNKGTEFIVTLPMTLA
ncbi:sensor histidine kinase [Fusibacter ferrireducens]|uniref:histidine kinase n=1 Tax=Fusibacter ferrireducens TaxID=2785058 RepID=A0ABR9ZVI5_9FIRM|nr:HAMP domain-containing sensor histidine kinase [Fusibacter ferrireducens]MBF4694469.1 HAMP domain-containing histidine kinase [Fusibacter ferrireducens]